MIYLYGPFLAFGFLIGSFVVWRRGKEEAYDEDQIFDAIVVTTLLGLLGARIHFVLLNFNYFGTNLIKWFWLTQYAGLRFPGGLVGGAIGLWWMVKSGRMGSAGGQTGFWPTADIAVFGLAIAQAIGKIGCFFNEYDLAQIFESLWMILIYLLLLRLERSYRLFSWYLGKKDRAEPGFLALTYLILYHLGRILLDLAYGQNFVFSAFIFCLGLVGLYWRSGREWAEDQVSLLTFAGSMFNKIRYRETTADRRKVKRTGRIKLGKEVK